MGINVCKCGKEISFDPKRRNQFRFCAECRARIGARKHSGKRKKWRVVT